MPLFQNATFFISAHHLRDLPPASGIEVAFAGRSNAGKSSALNTLANHNRLAYVSKQPGRTQLINFFTLLARYLSERTSLGGLVLVMDSRHPLTPLDRQMLDWFCPSGKPVHVLLTKSDKLSRSEATLTLNKVRKELVETWGNCSVQLFSSLKKQGVEKAEKVIGAWLFGYSSNSSSSNSSED
jgi:GTP-binding protein